MTNDNYECGASDCEKGVVPIDVLEDKSRYINRYDLYCGDMCLDTSGEYCLWDDVRHLITTLRGPGKALLEDLHEGCLFRMDTGVDAIDAEEYLVVVVEKSYTRTVNTRTHKICDRKMTHTGTKVIRISRNTSK